MLSRAPGGEDMWLPERSPHAAAGLTSSKHQLFILTPPLPGWRCHCPHVTEEKSEIQRMCQKISLCSAALPPCAVPRRNLEKPHLWAP